MNHLKDNNDKANNNKLSETAKIKSLPNYHRVKGHKNLILMAEKSQKIVTALYMVTDLIKQKDPLVQHIRTSSVDMMKRFFELIALDQARQVHQLSELAVCVFALSSYINVLFRNGNISQMNQNLLNAELSTLQENIELLIKRNMPYDRQKKSSQMIDEFSFTEDFFETSLAQFSPLKKSDPSIKDTHLFIKDRYKNSSKQDPSQTEVMLKQSNKAQDKKAQAPIKDIPKHQTEKDKRHDDILKILKQKKDAQVTDINALIVDCSSKTIQRDLNELVEKGLVEKKGERRWSSYNLS